MIAAGCLLVIAWAGPNQDVDWDALQAMSPGSARAQLVLEGLRNASGDLGSVEQNLAYAEGLRASAAFELELSIDLFQAVYDHTAAGWAQYNLALAQNRAGSLQQADQNLAELLASGPASEAPSLWSQRGIFAYGSGHDARGRALFGHAIGLGNADASAILAREALARHNHATAKRGFRAALSRNSDHPWALRGWGLSLLDSSDNQTEL